MNHRHLTSFAAAAIMLASATVRAQTPTPPTDPTVPAQPGSPPANPPDPPAAQSAMPTPAPVAAPVMNTKWKTSLYGFSELSIFLDSTKSFNDGAHHITIARPGTDAYGNRRLMFGPKNSRIGFNIAAPEYEGMKASVQIETDFFGPQPAVSEFNLYGQGLLRMRHFYFKLETPIIDMIAGQFHDLFAWGGGGFYPQTTAYLSIVGEAYNRRPQIRLSKTLKSDAMNVEIAASASRPFQRDSVTPDLMAGIKLVANNWKGPRGQGSGPAGVAPAALGLSGVYRKFNVNDPNSPMLGAPNYLKGTGWGGAFNLFLPIVPANGKDMANSMSLMAEVTHGEGIADMYIGLNGGTRFPTVMGWTPNIDGNVLTINGAELVPIRWTGGFANLQYHFPMEQGNLLWISFTGSMMKSGNIEDAHSWVMGGVGTSVWDTKYYGDASLFWALTPAVQFNFHYGHTRQVWVDDEVSTNHRGEAMLLFWF